MDDFKRAMEQIQEQFQAVLSMIETQAEQFHENMLVLKDDLERLRSDDVEDDMEADSTHFEDASESEGINSEADSFPSLCDDVNNSVSLVNENEMHFEVENSAYKVFDESPEIISDEIRTEIEAQFSDIYICETILRERLAQKIAIHEVNDVIVEMDDSKNLFSRHFKNEVGSLSLDVLVKNSPGEVMAFQFRSDVVYFDDFWGQKSLKNEVLSTRMAIENFGWKPGWIGSTNLGSGSSFLEGIDGQSVNKEEGKAKAHVEDHKEHGWVSVGIYNGFKGPDVSDFLMSNVYQSVPSLDCSDDVVVTLKIVDESKTVKGVEEYVVKSIGVLSKDDMVKRVFVLSDIEFEQEIRHNEMQLHAYEIKTSLLDHHAKLNTIEEALMMVGDTRDPNGVFYTALVCRYVRKEWFDAALKICRTMPGKNLMIRGYNQIGKNEEAVSLPIEMLKGNVLPTQNTFPCVFLLAGNIAAVKMGKKDHSSAVKHLGKFSVFVGNSLISFYAKCGNMEDNLLVFNKLQDLPFDPGIGFWKALLGECHNSWTDRKPMRLKITDFGITRASTLPIKKYTCEVLNFWYRVPEVFLGATHYLKAVDMWLVGCLFAELITASNIKSRCVVEYLEMTEEYASGNFVSITGAYIDDMGLKNLSCAVPIGQSSQLFGCSPSNGEVSQLC